MSITFVLLQKMKTINEANGFFVVVTFFFFFSYIVFLLRIFLKILEVGQLVPVSSYICASAV